MLSEPQKFMPKRAIIMLKIDSVLRLIELKFN